MRYNAPPSWPSPPVGWEPPAGWQPELAWPAAPEGWSFWVPEPGEAYVPPVGFADPSVPAWDPRSVRGSSAVTPASVAADNVVATGRTAWTLFLIGVAAFLLGAGSAILAARSRSGGTVWTGGMIVGVLFFWRALGAYRAARSDDSRAHPVGRVVVVGALVLCVAVGVTALVQITHKPDASPIAGSEAIGGCWNDTTGDDGAAMLEPVACSSSHDYVIAEIVTDAGLCSVDSPFYVELASTRFGCLVTEG
ncbi:hypothetical protein [Cellulomonas sp. WB94]|uniref:hypothetical protein n=1 Tax=Cellulomonas sp. WB94 TaxID=2173174 RepID=UPI0011B1E4C7|nr:hypothetical protein [Cellulomonas sp. WB94]